MDILLYSLLLLDLFGLVKPPHRGTSSSLHHDTSPSTGQHTQYLHRAITIHTVYHDKVGPPGPFSPRNRAANQRPRIFPIHPSSQCQLFRILLHSPIPSAKRGSGHVYFSIHFGIPLAFILVFPWCLLWYSLGVHFGVPLVVLCSPEWNPVDSKTMLCPDRLIPARVIVQSPGRQMSKELIHPIRRRHSIAPLLPSSVNSKEWTHRVDSGCMWSWREASALPAPASTVCEPHSSRHVNSYRRRRGVLYFVSCLSRVSHVSACR